MLPTVKFSISKTWKDWKHWHDDQIDHSLSLTISHDSEEITEIQASLIHANGYFKNLTNYQESLGSTSNHPETNTSNHIFNAVDLILCVQISIVSISCLSRLRNINENAINSSIYCSIFENVLSSTLELVKHCEVTALRSEIKTNSITTSYDEICALYHTLHSILDIKPMTNNITTSKCNELSTSVKLSILSSYLNIIRKLSKMHTNTKKLFTTFCSSVFPSTLMASEILFMSSNPSNHTPNSTNHATERPLAHVHKQNVFSVISQLYEICLFGDVKSLDYLAQTDLVGLLKSDSSVSSGVSVSGSVVQTKPHTPSEVNSTINTYFSVFYEILFASFSDISSSSSSSVFFHHWTNDVSSGSIPGSESVSLTERSHNSLSYLFNVYVDSSRKVSVSRAATSVHPGSLNQKAGHATTGGTDTESSTDATLSAALPIKHYERVLNFCFQILALCRHCSLDRYHLESTNTSSSSSKSSSNSDLELKVHHCWRLTVQNLLFRRLVTEFPSSIPYDKSLVLSQLKLRDCAKAAIVHSFHAIPQDQSNSADADINDADVLFNNHSSADTAIIALEFECLHLLVRLDHRSVLLLNDKRHKSKIKSLFKTKHSSAHSNINKDISTAINDECTLDLSAAPILNAQSGMSLADTVAVIAKGNTANTVTDNHSIVESQNNDTHSKKSHVSLHTNSAEASTAAVYTITDHSEVYGHGDIDEEDDEATVLTALTGGSGTRGAAGSGRNPLAMLMCSLMYDYTGASMSASGGDSLRTAQETLLCSVIETFAKLQRLPELFKYVLRSSSLLPATNTDSVGSIGHRSLSNNCSKHYKASILTHQAVQSRLTKAFADLQLVQYGPILKVLTELVYLTPSPSASTTSSTATATALSTQHDINESLLHLLQSMASAAQSSAFPVTLSLAELKPLLDQLLLPPHTSMLSTAKNSNKMKTSQSVLRNDMLICLYPFLTSSLATSFGDHESADSSSDAITSKASQPTDTTPTLECGDSEGLSIVTAASPSESINTMWLNMAQCTYSYLQRLLRAMSWTDHTVVDDNTETISSRDRANGKAAKSIRDKKTVGVVLANNNPIAPAAAGVSDADGDEDVMVDFTLNQAYAAVAAISFLMNAVSAGCPFNPTLSIEMTGGEVGSVSVCVGSDTKESLHERDWSSVHSMQKLSLLRHLDELSLTVLHSVLTMSSAFMNHSLSRGDMTITITTTNTTNISSSNSSSNSSRSGQCTSHRRSAIALLLFVLRSMSVWDKLVSTSTDVTAINDSGGSAELDASDVWCLLKEQLTLLFIAALTPSPAGSVLSTPLVDCALSASQCHSAEKSECPACIRAVIDMLNGENTESIRIIENSVVHASLVAALSISLQTLYQLYDAMGDLCVSNSAVLAVAVAKEGTSLVPSKTRRVSSVVASSSSSLSSNRIHSESHDKISYNEVEAQRILNTLAVVESLPSTSRLLAHSSPLLATRTSERFKFFGGKAAFEAMYDLHSSRASSSDDNRYLETIVNSLLQTLDITLNRFHHAQQTHLQTQLSAVPVKGMKSRQKNDVSLTTLRSSTTAPLLLVPYCDLRILISVCRLLQTYVTSQSSHQQYLDSLDDLFTAGSSVSDNNSSGGGGGSGDSGFVNDRVGGNKRRTRSSSNVSVQSDAVAAADVAYGNNNEKKEDLTKASIQAKDVWRVYYNTLNFLLTRQRGLLAMVSHLGDHLQHSATDAAASNATEPPPVTINAVCLSASVALVQLHDTAVCACYQPWSIAQSVAIDNYRTIKFDFPVNTASIKVSAVTQCSTEATVNIIAAHLGQVRAMLAKLFHEFIGIPTGHSDCISSSSRRMLQVVRDSLHKLFRVISSSNKHILPDHDRSGNISESSSSVHDSSQPECVVDISAVKQRFTEVYKLILAQLLALYEVCAEYVLSLPVASIGGESQTSGGSGSRDVWYILSECVSTIEHLRDHLSLDLQSFYSKSPLRVVINSLSASTASVQLEHSYDPATGIQSMSHILSLNIINRNVVSCMCERIRGGYTASLDSAGRIATAPQPTTCSVFKRHRVTSAAVMAAGNNSNIESRDDQSHELSVVSVSTKFHDMKSMLYFLATVFSVSTADDNSAERGHTADESEREGAADPNAVVSARKTDRTEGLLSVVQQFLLAFIQARARTGATAESAALPQTKLHSSIQPTSIDQQSVGGIYERMSDDAIILKCLTELFRNYGQSNGFYPLFHSFAHSFIAREKSVTVAISLSLVSDTVILTQQIMQTICFLSVMQAYVNATGVVSGQQTCSTNDDRSWVTDTERVSSMCSMMSKNNTILTCLGLQFYTLLSRSWMPATAAAAANQLSSSERDLLMSLLLQACEMTIQVYEIIIRHYDRILHFSTDSTTDTQAESGVNDFDRLNKKRKRRNGRANININTDSSNQKFDRTQVRDCLSVCVQSYVQVLSQLMFDWTPLLRINVSSPTHIDRLSAAVAVAADNSSISRTWCLKMLKLVLPTYELICLQTLPWLGLSVAATSGLLTHLLSIMIAQSDNAYVAHTTNTVDMATVTASSGIGPSESYQTQQQCQMSELAYRQQRTESLRHLYYYVSRILKVVADNKETTKHAPFVLAHLVSFLSKQSTSPSFAQSTRSIHTAAHRANKQDNSSTHSMPVLSVASDIFHTAPSAAAAVTSQGFKLVKYENYTNFVNIIYAGIFALLDKCRHRQRKQVYELLTGQDRPLFDELIAVYQRDFKFGASVESGGRRKGMFENPQD